ncbi:triple functional domain protein-like [Topomyia yanbarensis]|uniref:triple functional domain protein-like n=1 Tax=Topomyia yanbarensis TaxID=2498891 RepID=UPI00273A794A|nr:triple functional domain protein-like [Topomyia yanbarensis]XP_058828397.1 triple functional domain protein-like [Topomyia yanbarensis]XP_058828398.1 triple functional domain protein-like [Topomyia yanbarensis]XP_058828400.1 triple functional domain protein-like [Topomyia yanbarensis]XP_058828401.1 triple functional domain protein-like [Topomyia yanbarensis]XP_058828402.1 triple functional domain protein-like [Topomyia yanbarensis]XP_058828403.1 triple functional domain protein-like [Topom
MSNPARMIKLNRISRDSGICVEDGSHCKSLQGSESGVKKRFPAGGGGKTKTGGRSSYVRRLTQHFENLTCHDDSDRSTPTSSTSEERSSAAFHSDWNLSTVATVTPTEIEQQVQSGVNECDNKDERMDDAVEVIENIYEEILVGKKVSSKFAVRQHIQLSTVEFNIDRPGIHPANNADNGSVYDCDKISTGEPDSKLNRAVEFAEEATETMIVAEARNTIISQEPAHDDHYYDDDEFSDTDSFDSTDDEERTAINSRPDSNSSIKSERITSIMKELLENEENYVQTLAKGVEDYISVMHRKDLPLGLRGQRYHIFGNIENIFEFHKEKFLPKLRENRASIQGIAETFIKFIEHDRFYCYILFALNRPKSEKICNKNLEFFQERQNEVGDKLGLNSFLLQPIQRLPRYKLLLAEINKEVLKLIADSVLDSVKDEIAVLCKAEKRLERFIDVVNEAMSINDIRECYEINLFHLGKFRKMFEMDIYDWDRRRRYPGKIFFFEKCIIYTEKFKEYLEYRGHYIASEVGIYNDGKCKLCVFSKKRGIQEVEVSGSEIGLVQKLAGYIENVMRGYAMHERQRINDLNTKKDWNEQRVPSVKTINRGSMASTQSTMSVVSNASSRDSFESTSQTTWDADNPVQNLVTSQKHFCQILAANRKYYFTQLPEELSEKIHRFINTYDKILELHTKRVYEDLARPNVGIDELCELFIQYFKEDLFDPYNSYLKHFKQAAGIMKNIHRASRTSLTGTMVAQTTEDFTFLVIDIWNKYQNFVQTQIVRMSNQMNDKVNATDKDLFRKIAFIEVQISSFRKNLVQNYRLFNLDENLTPSSLGLVVYSERVRYSNETLSSHRILLCEKGTVCVKIQQVREIDRQAEKYNRIVFVVKFQRGAPVMKQSKKSDVRINFELNGNKHSVDFGNRAQKDKFLGNYCMYYEQYCKQR